MALVTVAALTLSQPQMHIGELEFTQEYGAGVRDGAGGGRGGDAVAAASAAEGPGRGRRAARDGRLCGAAGAAAVLCGRADPQRRNRGRVRCSGPSEVLLPAADSLLPAANRHDESIALVWCESCRSPACTLSEPCRRSFLTTFQPLLYVQSGWNAHHVPRPCLTAPTGHLITA